jgi:salicylate hydroxylase
MKEQMLICGGGIGGLASALASSRAGWQVTLLEQAASFGEVGAGIQLGPNVVRVLRALGVGEALAQVAAKPDRLEVRSALSGKVLGVLPLGLSMRERYGADYLTVARADLHELLLQAAHSHGVELHLNAKVAAVAQTPDAVQVETLAGTTLTTRSAQVLVGADGIWSAVRRHVVGDAPPRATGHLAYRAMLAQSALPVALRSDVVTVWLGPKFHAVQYPVRGGEWLNLVMIVQGAVPVSEQNQLEGWDHAAHASDLRRRLVGACSSLRESAAAIDSWWLWALFDRPPMASPSEQAKGRIALLGDAAHPMRPYLAQGAGMAIEDAAALAQCLSLVGPQGMANPGSGDQIPQALQHYAELRWQRNARVQARAIRNGEIFHWRGALQIGRDAAMKALGAKLLDVPWLYAGS